MIEIASDSDPGLDVREKLPRYRDARIDEIWLVNPFEQSVRAETQDPEEYRSRVLTEGRLDSIVLPGCWIEVSWLWREELPSTLECLRQILGTL